MNKSNKIIDTQIIIDKSNNHIYNKKGGKNPFLLQFKQLKYYYNLGKKLKNNISLGYIPQENEKNELNSSRNTVQNTYCLIDRKWLKKWKKHVGYKEIKNTIRKDKIERDLDNNDYKWISEIIDKNYKENYLNPLDNDTIYKDNEINPLADFKVIHKDCLKLFNIISKNSVINNNFRKYPFRLFKDKYIMILNNDLFFIVFKNANTKKFKEIIINFIEIKETNKEINKENNEEDNKSKNNEKISNKKKIIDILFNKDINEWFNEINFKFTELEKELEYNNCKIKIYNKTLMRRVERNLIRNSVFPNINDERNELLNSNILPNNLTKIINMQSKINQFMMRDIRPIDNNNHNNEEIATNMVFENINKTKRKTSKINLDIVEEKKNNNNIKKQKINELNLKTDYILNTKINKSKNKDNNDDNDDNQASISNKNNENCNEKKINNNSDLNSKQINNFINNQSQQNLSQNQNNNNNYNNNQNISQNNNNNNNINNYNIQNQIQCNNNNIIQNNNNQAFSQNNRNQLYSQNNSNQFYSQNNNNQAFSQNNNNQVFAQNNSNQFYSQNNSNQAFPQNNINQVFAQNNSNQAMSQNNSIYQNMNNNFNSQQNNQFFNLNNVQSNMPQQNSISTYNQNMQLNSVFQINQNNNYISNSQQNYNIDNNYFMMMMNMMNIYNNMMYCQNYLNNSNFQNNINSGLHYPHKSGLQNIGQTCYMNATIECLSNIKELTDHLLLNLNENFIPKENNLTISYRSLLIELFKSGQKSIVPEVFKYVIGELNPLFQGNHAADSKDLVFFIIERLHQELNIVNKNIQNNQKDFFQLEIESRNEQQMLQNFFNDFKLKNNSKISETFYGITRSVMDCKGCGIKKYSFQSFNMQIFQLKKLKDDKVLFYQNNENLNLIESFMLQQLPESLNNENMIYCNNCKGLKDGVHQQSIYNLPKVLIIILNRGRSNADFNEGFDFPPILDLRNQNVIIDQNSPHVFYLCGIITHLGESGSGGHFIAYCRNNQNDNFTFYNDAIVSEVSVESAISYKISNNESEKRTPYILFYHCI